MSDYEGLKEEEIKMLIQKHQNEIKKRYKLIVQLKQELGKRIKEKQSEIMDDDGYTGRS